MKRMGECDDDTLYIALDNIGINVGELDMAAITREYLQDLYRYLLRMQLIAWKAGKSHRQVIRDANLALREDKPIIKKGRLSR